MKIKNIVSLLSLILAVMLSFNIMTPLAYANSVNDMTTSVSKTDEKLSVSITGITDNEDKGQVAFWNTILSRYRGIIAIISGIATLTFILFFIVNFIKLGKSAGNPQERSHCIMGLVITGIATAGCGGVLLFVSVFYNMLA